MTDTKRLSASKFEDEVAWVRDDAGSAADELIGEARRARAEEVMLRRGVRKALGWLARMDGRGDVMRDLEALLEGSEM